MDENKPTQDAFINHEIRTLGKSINKFPEKRKNKPQKKDLEAENVFTFHKTQPQKPDDNEAMPSAMLK